MLPSIPCKSKLLLQLWNSLNNAQCMGNRVTLTQHQCPLWFVFLRRNYLFVAFATMRKIFGFFFLNIFDSNLILKIEIHCKRKTSIPTSISIFFFQFFLNEIFNFKNQLNLKFFINQFKWNLNNQFLQKNMQKVRKVWKDHFQKVEEEKILIRKSSVIDHTLTAITLFVNVCRILTTCPLVPLPNSPISSRSFISVLYSMVSMVMIPLRFIICRNFFSISGSSRLVGTCGNWTFSKPGRRDDTNGSDGNVGPVKSKMKMKEVKNQ